MEKIPEQYWNKEFLGVPISQEGLFLNEISSIKTKDDLYKWVMVKQKEHRQQSQQFCALEHIQFPSLPRSEIYLKQEEEEEEEEEEDEKEEESDTNLYQSAEEDEEMEQLIEEEEDEEDEIEEE